jgi:hypothetical protein
MNNKYLMERIICILLVNLPNSCQTLVMVSQGALIKED